MIEQNIVCPGETITSSEKPYQPGPFTHISFNSIRSSCLGRVKFSTTTDKNILVEVVPIKKPGLVPSIGSIVIAKVTSITRRLVKCDIVAVDSHPLAGSFKGLIRREDIRATQRDQAEPALCFRPSDLVRARVNNILGPCSDAATTSSGDASSSFQSAKVIASSVQVTSAISGSSSSNTVCCLTTAGPDLGVVIGIGRPAARTRALPSTGGPPLIPVSWTEMYCPVSQLKLPRKVARVPLELTQQMLAVVHRHQQ